MSRTFSAISLYGLFLIALMLSIWGVAASMTGEGG